MFGLGTGEILIIAAVLVVMLKPKDLPKIVRLVGKIVGRIRHLYAYVEETVRNMEGQIDGDHDASQRTTMRNSVGAAEGDNGHGNLKKDGTSGTRKAGADSVTTNPRVASQEGNHDRDI